MPRGEGRRIAHTKSRLGCQRCKARKVKCNEVHPKCSNCIKYGATCQYPAGLSAPASGLRPSSAMSENSSRRSMTPPTTIPVTFEPSGLARSQERLLELQLMHHYSTVTCQQAFISNHDPGMKDLYIRLAPILALKQGSLMNGLLAAAALHIYKLDPDKILFRDLNRKYFNAAVTDQRRAVATINRDNADGICLGASFIAFQALAIPQDSPSYTVPSLWLDLTTGHASLFRSAWTWLNDSNQILPIVNAEPNLQSFRDLCWQEYPATFPENLEATIFPALLEFQDPTENLDAERIGAYQWALAFIGHSLSRIESGEDPSRIRRLLTAFGALSPPIYKTMVRKRQARALVVLAYLFAILKAADSVWWLRGIPEREVFGLQSILPERWQWAMAWPIQKLSYYAVAAIPPREAANSFKS